MTIPISAHSEHGVRADLRDEVIAALLDRLVGYDMLDPSVLLGPWHAILVRVGPSGDACEDIEGRV